MKWAFRILSAFLLAALVVFNVSVTGAWATGSLSETCEDFDLTESIFEAKCKNDAGEFVPAKIDLNSLIGSINGRLQWGGSGFSEDCYDVRSEENMLTANCFNNRLGYLTYTGINLDDRITNSNGVLSYSAKSISETCMDINATGPFLEAKCKNDAGEFVPAEIDLDSLIGNIDGRLQWGYSDFYRTCYGVSFEGNMLTAECQTRSGSYRDTEINLDENIANDNGVLSYGGRRNYYNYDYDYDYDRYSRYRP